MFPLGGDLLAIYLQDHLAGSTGGLELARRARGSNDGTRYGDFLAQLERELAEDREALHDLMERLDVGEHRVKVALAWAAEKAGRLKLNGRLTGYSPLSRLVEVEALMAGVTGKLSGWRSLRALAERDQRLDPVELDRLIARAERQLSSLAEHQRQAAGEALPG
ncbi:MAG: hypothetical protein ABR581_11030 [Thermoleophilaceae bacterium]